MNAELPFAVKILILTLVLPLALVWIASAASVATLAVKKAVARLRSRRALRHPISRDR